MLQIDLLFVFYFCADPWNVTQTSESSSSDFLSTSIFILLLTKTFFRLPTSQPRLSQPCYNLLSVNAKTRNRPDPEDESDLQWEHILLK